MERVKGLILFIVLFAGLASGGSARAETAIFSKGIKASLIFELAPDPPHHIQVYLHLVNLIPSDVNWVCNSVSGIEAELLDPLGKQVHEGPTAVSILSHNFAFLLPYGSRIDWLISHEGMSGMDDLDKGYTMVVGGKRWFIPKESIGSYSLRIRLHGDPFERSAEKYRRGDDKLLLDLPPRKIVISRS